MQPLNGARVLANYRYATYSVVACAVRLVDVTIDGQTVRVPEGATLLEACRQQGIDTPTLCYLENLTPVNVCRVCVVEVEKSRTLVSACSRKAEAGMVVHTDSERVRTSRRMVLEFLTSSVDTSCPNCGVGCNLELHVQDNRIVKVTSPLDHDVTHGHLCVKGRFGFEFVQRRAGES
jgi:NADH dehydrogenase/NADH:ubiquinone oxidoreductase subunit G